MLQKTIGIVLRVIKYNDSSNIVDIFTECSGHVSFIVKVSRSKKGGIRPMLFQPFSVIEFEADFRLKADLCVISHAKSYMPFRSIPFDPVKRVIGLFISEFLYRALRQETENRPLFAYLLYSIKWLDECEEGFTNFHLVFLIRLSRFLGLFPNLENYSRGCFFDMVNACFVTVQPFHSSFLPVNDASMLTKLVRMNYETMYLFKMSRTDRNRCLVLINDYYRLHLPDFPVLKSLDVLNQLFCD